MFFKRAKKSDEVQAAAVPDVVQPVPSSKPAATTHQALDAEKLRRATVPGKLGFKTTADIADVVAEPFESRRVWDALRAAFLAGTPAARGHVLVTVPTGCTAARAVSASLAALPNALDTAASDWIYVRPRADAPWAAVAVGAGQGNRFAAGMTAVLAALRSTLPYLLTSEDLKRRRFTIEDGFAAVRDDAFARLHANAHAQNVAVVTTPMGFAVAPMHEGKVVKPEVLARLPQAMRDDVRRKVESVEAELQTLLADVPSEAGSQIAEVNELISDYVRPAVAAGFEGLVKEFSDIAPVMAFLTSVQHDILSRACTGGAGMKLPEYHGRVVEGAGKALVTLAAPVTHEALSAACLRAGKGAVLIDAEALDAASPLWPALKAVLQTRSVLLDGIGESVPVECSVVLLCPPALADRLDRDDAGFAAQFHTRTAFAADAARSEDSESTLGRMLGQAAAAKGLLPLEAAAVAQLVAESARATGRPDRISGDLTQPLAIAADASRIAALASRTVVTEADVLTALAERRTSARVQSLFSAPSTRASGRVLAVGLAKEPVEVWATVRGGNGTAADIARAVAHTSEAASSASAMLWSYVAGRYVPAAPLSLSAAIVHEPPIAASSAVRASAAEVYALLSALAEAPIATSYAVAGWVSPSGALLPVADINEAIESAFDHAGGRDTAQPLNLVIPRGNEAGLMLRADLVDAARKGKLQIFTAADVEEGLAILTGEKAGSRSEDGEAGGLNRRIEDRLMAFARQRGQMDSQAAASAVRAAPKAAAP